MAKAKKHPARPPTCVPVTKQEMKDAATQMRAVVALARETEGFDEFEIQDLEGSAEDLDKLTVPSMRNVALAAMSGEVSTEVVLQSYHRAIVGLHTAAPLLVLKALELAEGGDGNATIVLGLLKGLGLLVPAEPMAAKDRGALVDNSALRALPTDELRRRVLEDS